MQLIQKRIVQGVVLVGALSAVGVMARQAQAPTGFQRTVVQQQDLPSTPNREVVQVVAEIQPGAESGRHTHPGEEVGYVLEGTVTLESAGKPDVVKKAGDGFVIPSGTVHNAKNASTSRVRVLATYFIEKGRPAATPVK
jgi:quercetin dioxygenase-like cupin family protein